MAFLIYKKQKGELIATGETFSLARHNLVYHLWTTKCVTDDDLILTLIDLTEMHMNLGGKDGGAKNIIR